MPETDMSGFETGFEDRPEVAELVADMRNIGKVALEEGIVGEEAMDFSAEIITGIARALETNPRCIAEEDCLMLRLDPHFDTDAAALKQPNLSRVRQVIAVTGPVSSSAQPEFWYRAGVQVTDIDGEDMVYEFERDKAPSINVIGYDPYGQQDYAYRRTLNQDDLSRLYDVVKALDSSQAAEQALLQPPLPDAGTIAE